ncbi:MAG: hypothetical protein R2769_04220 [Saprospiraceae bacterium]
MVRVSEYSSLTGKGYGWDYCQLDSIQSCSQCTSARTNATIASTIGTALAKRMGHASTFSLNGS